MEELRGKSSEGPPSPSSISRARLRPQPARTSTRKDRQPLSQHTLVDFLTESALLSLLEVLAALGEFRPLDRMSSLMGEALPSGLVGCFLRPLRSVDICWLREKGKIKGCFQDR